MKISRSPRALEVLRFVVKNEPKTLYKIGNTLKVKNGFKDKPIPWGSLDFAIKNLVKKNLIRLDLEKSRGIGRNATIYVPTFKGLIVFLSNYPFPKSPSIIPSKDGKSIRIKAQMPTREAAELERILEKNGELLRYPLFQNCRFLELRPRLYELFIQISEAVLRSHFRLSRYEQSLLIQKTKLEKDIVKTENLPSAGWGLIMDGREMPYGPAESYKEELESVNLMLKAIYTQEDQILRESFFLEFLKFLSVYTRTRKLPNQELYNYTMTLLGKKEKEFKSIREQLEKGLALFSKG